MALHSEILGLLHEVLWDPILTRQSLIDDWSSADTFNLGAHDD